eukprot:COSAG05_NODE_12_length_37297_cov_117.537072_7_plen_82_part_00
MTLEDLVRRQLDGTAAGAPFHASVPELVLIVRAPLIGDGAAACEEKLRSWLKTEVGVKKLGQREKIIVAVRQMVNAAGAQG